MEGDALFESCLPILKDDSLEEEDKTEKIEEHVRKRAEITGKALETAVLDVLWRFRNAGATASSPTHSVRKTRSPAPWQQSSRSSTPVAASPRSNAGSPAPGASKRPQHLRLGTAASPFSSPKPSPRFTFASPHIPHSPSLDTYEFAPSATTPDIYGDYGSTEVDWLVNEEGQRSFTPGGSEADPTVNWLSSQNVEMSPYDILRSVIRDDKTDEEIEKVLEANGYDLTAAIAALTEGQGPESPPFSAPAEPDRTFLVGKSMAPSSRPATPAGQQKSPVVCRYWLSTGQCLRADCRFSHDLSNHVCKYWLQGNCLAGSSCIFSHDPALLMNNISLNGPTVIMTPPLDTANPAYQPSDYMSFPTLGSSQPTSPAPERSLRDLYSSKDTVAPPPGFSSRPALAPEFIPSRPQSRQSPAPRSPGFQSDDNNEAFPSLGSAAALRGPRKHHGKRGHGHTHRPERENVPSSLADVVRMAPTPPQPQSPRRTLRGRTSYTGSHEHGLAAQAIPGPDRIPWLETGDRANKAYLKARQEAIRHGGARNKFLQSAAQAWHRNDVRAAKTLSLRGQSENQLMREAHRTAAKALYDERNPHQARAHPAQDPAAETFIDLHGLHPAEAVSYLANALSAQRGHPAGGLNAVHRVDEGESARTRFLYAIVGTGHHSRGGRDKVGRAVRAYLNECGYEFREFGAPGDKGPAAAGGGGVGGGYFAHPGSGGAVGGVYAGGGGILGVDVLSGDLARDAAAREEAAASEAADGDGDGGGGEAEGEGDGVGAGDVLGSPQPGRVRILKAGEI